MRRPCHSALDVRLHAYFDLLDDELSFAGLPRTRSLHNVTLLLAFRGAGRRFIGVNGRYDLLGTPQNSDGGILIEPDHPLKGQAAPCLIPTDVDSE